MIIFPAVDIKEGQAVRLKQGLADQVTVFDQDPCACALRFVNEGARWLHVVDLDGAFAGSARSYQVISQICASVPVPVQLGGGIRDEETAARYLDCGVSCLIIGTMALEEPTRFQKLCQRFCGKIGVSLDADQGIIKTRGWVKDTGLDIAEVLPTLTEAGAAFLIYTDIKRDGMQCGPNFEMLAKICQDSPLPVLAAGGISTLADIKKLYPLSQHGMLEGVISGRALYEGTLSLKECETWLRMQEKENS